MAIDDGIETPISERIAEFETKLEALFDEDNEEINSINLNLGSRLEKLIRNTIQTGLSSLFFDYKSFVYKHAIHCWANSVLSLYLFRKKQITEKRCIDARLSNLFNPTSRLRKINKAFNQLHLNIPSDQDIINNNFGDDKSEDIDYRGTPSESIPADTIKFVKQIIHDNLAFLTSADEIDHAIDCMEYKSKPCILDASFTTLDIIPLVNEFYLKCFEEKYPALLATVTPSNMVAMSRFETKMADLASFSDTSLLKPEELLISAIKHCNTNFEATLRLSQLYELRGDMPKSDLYLKDSARIWINSKNNRSHRKYLNNRETIFKIKSPCHFMPTRELLFKLIKGNLSELQKTQLISSCGTEYQYALPFCIVTDGNEDYMALVKSRSPGESLTNFLPNSSYMAITFAESLDYIKEMLDMNKEMLGGIDWWDSDECYTLCKNTYIERALQALARMQVDCKKLISEDLFNSNPYPQIQQKVNLLGLSTDEKMQIQLIANKLSSLPYHIAHCDFHLDNIVDIGNESCIIDFEKTCLANRFYDLAFLLEQSEINMNNGEKQRFVDYFVKQLTLRGEILSEDPYTSYKYNALFVNLLEASFHGDKLCEYYSFDESKMHLERTKSLLTQLHA